MAIAFISRIDTIRSPPRPLRWGGDREDSNSANALEEISPDGISVATASLEQVFP